MLRLYYLQVLATEEFTRAAESNQVRFVPIEPKRGRIVDRNGTPLIDNRPSNVITVRMEELEEKEETLNRLSQVIGIPREQIDRSLADKRVLPYTPIPVARDVPEEIAVYLTEHNQEFPGIEYAEQPVRIYPQGLLAAHILGYTGEITSEQLELERYQRPYRYRLGSNVGRSGMEYAYESELRGRDGLIKQPVDATGKVLSGKAPEITEPVPGLDVVSSIDVGLQKLTEESLAQGIAQARRVFDEDRQKNYLAPGGAAVVLDPRSGEVLAMASYPTYDPAAFVGGISKPEFDAMLKDPANPLLNRTIQAEFPPGSTFKPVTAAAALQDGIATRGGRYNCPSSVRLYRQTFRNWRTVDTGGLTVSQALRDSCNTVFYGFADQFWRRYRSGQGERLQDYARRFGLGARTGIELPFEKSGRVPDEGWLKSVHQRFPQAFPYSEWLPGYTINLAIGQGDLNLTPLQLANAYGAIANGGTLVKPRTALRITDGTEVEREIGTQVAGKLDVDPANLETVRRGMELVVTEGTARGVFSGFPLSQIPVAGKTGSAQLQTRPPKQPFSWFGAFAPIGDPRYVVVVMVEEAGAGSETAAPITRRILEGLFGLPLSDIQPGARTEL